jgi:hypothetical protein
MHRLVRIALATLLAASALATWTGAASAGRLSINRTLWRIAWSSLTFTSTEGRRVTCAVTLSAQMEASTFTKVINLRLGRVLSAQSSCSEIVFLTETTWDILYESFNGTLPRITNLNFKINGFAFRWVGVINCVYRSDATHPLRFNGARNFETWQITRVDAPGALYKLPPTTGSHFLCTNARDEAYMNGSGNLTIWEEGEGIFLTLI